MIGLTFLGVLLCATSIWMMMLILVQRGKGGGLTGALGGMGGQSAFGAKAGDVFTKITVISAIIWITLCMITIAAFNPPPSSAGLKDKSEDMKAIISGVEDEEASADADSNSVGGMSAGSDSSETGDAAGSETEIDSDAALEKFIEDEVGIDAPTGEAEAGDGTAIDIEPSAGSADKTGLEDVTDSAEATESTDDQK